MAATRTILAAATAQGAVLREGVEVRDFRTENGRVTGLETAEGPVDADHVVLAAGVGSQALASRLNVALPTENTPGLLIHTTPTRPLINRLVLSPGVHFKQDPDGRIVAGQDYGGGPVPTEPQQEGQRLVARLNALLHDRETLELADVTVGERIVPLGGMPTIGRAPALESLYVAVMHSGITLAPIVGRLAADEILDDIEANLLAPFRLP